MKNTNLFSKSLLGFAENSQNGKNGGGGGVKLLKIN
jgi:hypothetical protein